MSWTGWLVGNRSRAFFPGSTLLVLLIWLIGRPPSVQGQATFWQGQTGSWDSPGNWDNGVPNSSTTANIDNGGTALVQSSGDTSSGLLVGNFGTGSLVVQGQGQLSSGGPVVIGFLSNSDGTVSVNGSRSIFTAAGYVEVGAFGTGKLTVENGGFALTNGYLQIGLFSGGDGTVAVNGSGSSLTSTGDMVVGGSGTGRLGIENGGAVTGNVRIEIGFDVGGNGMVIVSGSGSILKSAQPFYVGYSGTGILSITEGAIVRIGNGIGTLNLGSQAGSRGTLNIGNGAAAGSLEAGEVKGGAGIATVNFNETDQSFIFPIALTGSLTVAQNGSGKTVLTGTNTYTSGTMINAGTLQVSADNNLGASSGGVTFNGGTLQFGASFNLANSRVITLGGAGGAIDTDGFSTTISQQIIGLGSLTKTGVGTLIITGTNAYTGGTTLDAGTIVVNNAQALGFGNVTINGGILTADPQPINVKGDYTQTAGGTLQLQVAGNSTGQYDFLNVVGNVSLGGTLQLLNLGYKPKAGDRLALVAAQGTVSGQFSHFIDPFSTGSGFNTVNLVYGKNSLVLEFLELTVSPVPPVLTTIDFVSFAQTPNQSAAADLLDAVQLNPRAANLMSFLYQEPFANLPSDFDKISPESFTAFYEISFSGANIQRLNLENRLEEIRDRPSGTANSGVYLFDGGDLDGKSTKNPSVLPLIPEKRWDFWSTSFGDFVHVDSNFNARGYKFTTGGIDVGIDYRFTGHLAFGLMGSYAHTWSDLRPGSIDVDSARGGIYATYFDRCFYINGGIYGGYNSYDSSRRGLQGNANGNSDGAEFSTFVSGGYDFRFGHLTIGPIASLQYTNVYLDSFSERSSLAPLSIHSDSEESLRSDVGFRASYQWRIGSGEVEPFLKATWEHEFKYSTLPITAGFANISGPSAIFVGPAEGHDSAILDAGISVSWTPCVSIYVSYNGQLGRDRYDSNAVSGGVRFSF
jgi:outer membrane autotransporter protein